jgi:predicted TIM-barrel fold metal-dependent hydrolase
MDRNYKPSAALLSGLGRGCVSKMSFLLGTLFGATIALSAQPTPPPPPIIDVHIHAEPVPPAGVPRPTNCGSVLQEFAPRNGRAEFNIEEVRSHCDKVLVAPATDADNRAAVLKYFKQFNMTGTLLGSSFAETATWNAEFGARGIPAIGMKVPGSPSIEELREAITAGKVRLLGEIGVQYAGVSPDADSMEPYFALAEKMDFPIGIHIGLGAPAAAYVGQPGYLASLTHPMLLEPVLRKHSRLRIYVMHAGWPMADEMVHLMYSHPQVYVDTGIIDWGIPRKEFYHHLQRLVDAGFANRIMFGTDQMIWPDAIPVAIDAIQKAPFLSEAQKRDILYRNAVRFFRLSPE